MLIEIRSVMNTIKISMNIIKKAMNVTIIIVAYMSNIHA